MKTIRELLQQKFQKALCQAYPQEKELESWAIDITQSTQEKFGHYQCNSAMKLAKILQETPRKIAEKILPFMETFDGEGNTFIAKLELAGPGFINVTIDSVFLAHSLQSLLKDPKLGIGDTKKNEKIIIDFSSPNIAKEMHVGHLRSTIIGDCIARLFEFMGYDVLRLNHLGDWGTAFGMLIAYIKQEVPQVLTGEEKTDLSHLVSWYKASKSKFDNDPSFKKTSQLEVVALQRGDVESLQSWKMICEISLSAYQEIYNILGVKLINRGESFYNPMLPEIIVDLEKKGLMQISNGAKCIFLDGFLNREGDPLPLMLQKSDGGFNYDTTDIAAIRQRIQEEHGTRLIYVTDAGQATHFQMIFKTAEKAGYLDTEKIRVDHVPFGLVLGADGKKFKTRSGDTEKLIDLLTTAVQEAEKILVERSPEMPSEQRQELAKSLGIGAVKYADLSCNRIGDYLFSYEKMLRFEGNTAAYLMYTYVRVAGIKRKINADIDPIVDSSKIRLEHPSEISLGMHLRQFDETLEIVASELLPNRLTDYLYGLSEKFNAFFRDCRVEGTPEQNSRLLLCELTARTMKTGLEILGLTAVERM
jgi:arginyl-tRNA synthetase